ncbi:hypothetical protein RBB75_02345 [Tunturibacter empetritectus]|uniref:Uncharacterized protein n=1 Tax=Tunturiibacter empetritectus TaxID=3069691 RepID=A0AAU7ZFQ8_9BACT
MAGAIRPSASRVKNKLQNRGVFLAAGKVTAKHHALTTNPPQPHHALPAKKHHKTVKPPAKTPLYRANIFSRSKPQKLAYSSFKYP